MNTRALITTLLLAAALSLTACGGSGDSGPKTGTVAVVITDAPTDIYDRVEISLTEMTLIGAGGQVELHNGQEITFDLLEMSEWGDLAFASQVLEGTYNKIRLQISGITLYDTDDTENTDGVQIQNLPANGKIDLNPRGSFDVTPGVTTVIELDIDAQRAFQTVQTGQGRIQFRPIIFVDVRQAESVSLQRLVRAFGTVEAVSTDANSFRLCDLQFVSQTNAVSPGSAEDCIHVYADGTPGIFGETGTASTDFGIVGEGQPVTAIGWLGATDDPDAYLGLQAVVLEVGDRAPGTAPGWDTMHGSVRSDADDCVSGPDLCFDFDPSADAAMTTIVTHMQPESKVYRLDGAELMKTDISTGDIGSIDGILDGTNGELLAALVVLSTDAGGASAVGTVADLSAIMGDSLDEYHIVTITKDDGSTVDVCIPANTAIGEVLVNDGIVTILDVASIQVGDRIEAYPGTDPAPDPSCEFLASTVIVEPAP